MFSRRTRWALADNPLATLLAQRRQAGRPVLDLTLSNPTAAALPYPADLLSVLADPRGLRYEPLALGRPETREAVAQDVSRLGVPVDPASVVLTASTSEGYAHLFKLLCDPGDVVLAPSPSYPLFEFLAELESVSLRSYPLRYDGDWHVDLAQLAERIDERTRAVVVVSPNNPTGSYLKRHEAEALAALCASRDIAIVSDEVFADYALEAPQDAVRTLAGAGDALTFCLGGLSKSCGLPQLKLGWISVSGPDALRAGALGRLEVIADTFLSVSTPVQLAAPSLLARRDELQRPIHDRVAANLSWLRRSLPPTSPVTALLAEGGWSVVLQVPATRSEEEWGALLLEHDGVLVHPGWYFDFPREAFLVVSLLPERAVFEEGAMRLLARVQGAS